MVDGTMGAYVAAIDKSQNNARFIKKGKLIESNVFFCQEWIMALGM